MLTTKKSVFQDTTNNEVLETLNANKFVSLTPLYHKDIEGKRGIKNNKYCFEQNTGVTEEATKMSYEIEYSNRYENKTELLKRYQNKYGMSKGFARECMDEFTKFIKDKYQEALDITEDYDHWYSELRDDQKQYLDGLEENGELGTNEFYGINFAHDYLKEMFCFYLEIEHNLRQNHHTDFYRFLLYNDAIISALELPFDASSKEFFIQAYENTFNFFVTKYSLLKEMLEVSELVELKTL
ncbi:hypothetical protein [Borrelia sp. RT1S]|uniref:hypothetical protein n=1 Tax=Borrelia sp. RT1S TaxID=2898580 RepID=UPI001E5E5E7C|nr:hypothetical protein [Borrelia sp. RT1S]UGQ17942.1 hypothetical protein LSO05_05780 [Borrelia sp. RT1S]